MLAQVARARAQRADVVGQLAGDAGLGPPVGDPIATSKLLGDDVDDS